MRGSKKSKKKIKQTEISPKTNFTTNTGFVISEFSIQERLPRKTVVQMEKQALLLFFEPLIECRRVDELA
jgi:hypothetical protein